jgi:hypothetical protein
MRKGTKVRLSDGRWGRIERIYKLRIFCDAPMVRYADVRTNAGLVATPVEGLYHA